MISKQQFDMCVNALNNGGAFITHRGYYGIRTSAQSGLQQINSEVFSAVVEYCGGRDRFQVTDTRTQFGIESTWELIDPVYGELPTFARSDVDSKLTKTLEFKQKVDAVKKTVKDTFGCAPYERKNNAKYTLLKFWANSDVDMSKLNDILSVFSDVSAKQLTRREFNVTIYPDTEPKFEFTDDLMEALDRAHLLDESTKGDAVKKLKDAASSVKCKLTPGFKRYALESPDYVDNIIEDELLYCGKALCKEFPNMKYWKFGENNKLCDMYGSYCVVETGTEEGKVLVQLDGHGRIYHLEESLYEATTSETTYEDWDDVYFAIEDIIESCTIFGRHPYWFDAYTRPDRLILDIGVDDDDTGRTGSHYEATLANLDEVPTNTNELIQYVENLPWKATGETDVDDEYDLDDNM